uniref:Obscurin-like protein 1 n=1 Tax=Takifugu rubripes TaxID=31033 RepID=H2SES5_TAKRU
LRAKMDVFGGAPRFLAYPRPVVVQSGADAVLKCQIGGDPRPAVIWERNNEKIDLQGRYRVFEDGNVYNLIITVVTIEDSGQYICKAKNSIGETYAAATLKVEGEAQEMELREENKPRFLIKPLSTRVGRGDDAVFSCKLWGNPRPDVVWEKDGKKLNEIFESTHFSVGFQDGGWFQLKIFKTRAPDGGVYTCKARNDFGEALAGAEGNRNEDTLTKSTKVKMFAVTEGKHAKFRCFVTGKPKPEIIWRKDGKLILSGRRYLLYEDREGYFTLKVLYCKQKDNGVYVCAASNTAGQTLSAVHLSVKEPPVRFKQPLIDLEVWERDLAVLECEVPEDSVPITWYLEDRRLQPGAKYGMEEWGTKRRLTIRDIGVDDDGIYLCEMPDGGRSIAEVAVKGTILRKLPRKVDVLEGENAAYCVEVEKEEMDIHWYKDGVELRETHQTIIKSFGRTHILVFVNTMPQDSGLVTFLVGRSKTSSQLRVKAARHCPPSCPVGVQINTERANAALLSWVPAQDSRRNPPSGYVLERQEVGTGSQEWLQCLTTDSATSVEILGDSVPCEADYRFRICSVNKYGKSNNVEFPRGVHLVPVARIQAPLQDALVPEGQDAHFSIELSASVIGTWFLNGTQLQEDERYSMRRTRTHQSLRIRGVRDTDNGAEITFIAYGIRDSAAMYIQDPAAPVHWYKNGVELQTMEGCPIVLQCELSDPCAQVYWYKDGSKLLPQPGVDILTDGFARKLIIPTAEFFHTGLYCCKTKGDSVLFNVDVKAPPVKFSAIPEELRTKWIEAGCPLVLQCVVSDDDAHVCWYRDEMQLIPHSGLEITSEGNRRTLVVQCTEPSMPNFEVEGTRSVQMGKSLELDCEVADSSVPVCWYKDGVKLLPQHGWETQSNGTLRRLVIPTAELLHAGLYSCESSDDTIHFTVDIKAPPVKITTLCEAEKKKSVEAGEPLMLRCEISDPNAQVTWYKDGVRLHEAAGHAILAEASARMLMFGSAVLSHAGIYCCKTRDDAVAFHVDVKAQPARFSYHQESDRNICVHEGSPIVLRCELSHDPSSHVDWTKDGIKLLPQNNMETNSEGLSRTLHIHSAEKIHAGVYECSTSGHTITFEVDVKEPPVRILSPSQSQMELCQQTSERMVLSCEISRPNAVVRWYRNGLEVEENNNLILEGKTHKLTINPLQLSDSGEYVCDVNTDEMHFSLSVKGKNAAPLEDTASLKGSSLTLRCEINKLGGDVQWLKDGQEICPGRRHTIRAQGRERSITIHQLMEQDSGEYVCESTHDRTWYLLSVPRVVEILAELRNITVCEGEDAVFKCVVSPEDARLVWRFNGKQVTAGGRVVISSNGLCHMLCIHNCTVSDSTRVTAEAEGLVSEAELQVIFTKKMLPVTAEEYSEATLEVEVSLDTGEVQWMRQGVLIHPGAKCTLKHKGRKRSLTIHNLAVSDRGTYSCETLHDRTQTQLTVEPRKITIKRGLTDIKTTERETATFEVELSHPQVVGMWMRNGIQLKQTNHFRMSAKGKVHSLTVSNLLGIFVSQCSLITTLFSSPEPPVTIVRKLQDQRVSDGAVISIECELSRHNVDVKWTKNGTEIKPSKDLRIYAMGRKRFLQILKCNVVDSGIYTCDAGDTTTSCNVEVYERELLITQGLNDLDIQEDQNAVFICELTVEDIPGEWYKNGERIQPTSTVKIRQEGQWWRGVSRTGALNQPLSFLELPVNIVKPLEDKTALEMSRVILDCTVSNPRCSIRWYKGCTVILPSERFEICSEGGYRKLIIQQVALDDAGTYSVQVGEYSCSAKLTVEGKSPPSRTNTVSSH